jgi:hypothetical protein
MMLREAPMTDDITFEKFTKKVTAPLSAPLEGDTISSPVKAAERAAFEASVTHAKKRGTILVACRDSSDGRACLDQLKFFFEDQPQLAQLFKRATSDTIELQNGQRILVTTAPRRPRDLLVTIRLEPETARTTPEAYPGDRELARRLLLMYRHAIHTPEDQLNAAELEFKASPIYAAIKQLPPSRDDDERWQAWRRCQRGLHSGSSLEGLVSEDPGRTKIVTQKLEPGHPDYREDWQLPAIEQRRSQELKERAGQDDPRGGPALTGPRGPRWRR